jgi:putative sigma-54 modulation protein
MQVSITFRNMESTDALKDYANKKMGKLKKYLNSSFEAKVNLSVDKKSQHLASVNLSSNTGLNIQGEEKTKDMYSSIDLVISKLERQIKKHRQKLRTFSPSKMPAKIAQLNIYSPESFYDDSVEEDTVVEQDDAMPVVMKSEEVSTEYLTVREAVMKLEFKEEDVLVFTNKDTGKTSMLHIRKDGNYGLIEL